MEQLEQQIFAQFGDQAAAVQHLLNAAILPLQQEINTLNQQLAVQAQAAPQIINQNIQDAIAQGVAQIQPPVPAPAPVPVQPQQPKDPKVADPPIFSGNRNEVRSFIRSLRTIFALSPGRFPVGDEVRRILFALGWMQGGTAGSWATNVANQFLDPNAANPYNTFELFQTALERAFGSLDLAQKARTEMAALKMKSGDTVEEYTTAFEALAVHTGYGEAAHIQAYRTGLLPRLLEKIYNDTNGDLPANLEAWKTKARRLDYLYHEFKALHLYTHASVNRHQINIRKRDQRLSGTPDQGAPPPPHHDPPPPPPAPMDVDGHRGRNIRCYNCNRFGHMARQCPEPKRSRSIRTAEIEEMVRSIISEPQVKSLTRDALVENNAAVDFLLSQQ